MTPEREAQIIATEKLAIELADKEMPRARMFGWNERAAWQIVYWAVMGGIGLFPYPPGTR